MSIFHPGYQDYVRENYDPADDEKSLTDEEITEMESEYERNQSVQKCSECSAEIKVYVGRDSDALDWRESLVEPKDERERRLFELDPLSFYERQDFIKPEYLICRDCRPKLPARAVQEEEIPF